MTQILLYKTAVKEVAKKELTALNNFYEAHGGNADKLLGIQNMFYRDARDGTMRIYAHKKTTLADRYTAVRMHQNKQYQWLLAEAYEAYEDFLEDAYAYMGYLDKNKWPLADFGSATLSELPDKKFEWFKGQVSSKRDKPKSILNQFRKVFPEVSNLERHNFFNLDLGLALKLIEKLHIIVHLGGIAKDVSLLRQEILKDLGLFNNNNPDPLHLQFIDSYFGEGDYASHVVLLEKVYNDDLPIEKFVDTLGHLIELLVTHAAILVEYTKKLEDDGEVGGEPIS